MGKDVQAIVDYHAQAGFWQSVHDVTTQEIGQRGGAEPCWQLWRALAMAKNGRSAEGIRELERLTGHREYGFAADHVLAWALQQSKMIDQDALREVRTRLRAPSTAQTDQAKLTAVRVMWHLGRHDDARTLASKVLEANPNLVDALTLRGWIDLTCGRDTMANKCVSFFERAFKVAGTSTAAVMTLLGVSRYHYLVREFPQAIDCLDQLIVQHAWFAPALTEKALVQLAMSKWEHATETIQRVLQVHPNDVTACHLQALHVLCEDPVGRDPVASVRAVLNAVRDAEPRAAPLLCQLSRPLARLADGRAAVLAAARDMLHDALASAPDSSEIHAELGYQCILAGELDKARDAYNKALQCDGGNAEAVNGLIHCQLLAGQLDDAAQQLEFLKEIEVSMGRTAKLNFLSALLASRRNGNAAAAVKLLDEALSLHIKAIRAVPVGPGFYTLFNPAFCMDLVREYMQLGGTTTQLEPGQARPKELEKAMRLVDLVVKNAPGLMSPHYFQAKAQYIARREDKALRALQTCLAQDASHAESHLLLAQIHLAAGHHRQAQAALEQAISYNFAIRKWPQYAMIKAALCEATGDVDNAIAELQTALSLPGVRRPLSAGARDKAIKAGKPVPTALADSDRASIFLRLAQAHARHAQMHEATKVIMEASNEFRNTSQQMRVVIAHADVILMEGKVDAALAQLNSVPKDHPMYSEARQRAAQIYLEKKHSKREYIRCFRDIEEAVGGRKSAMMMADAYMRVQDPEAAIGKYETVLAAQPGNTDLALKIGSALIKTHDYSRAIRYYTTAANNATDAFPLRVALAELYQKLHMWKPAAEVITDALRNTNESSDDVSHLVQIVQLQLVLSRVFEGQGSMTEAVKALMSARGVQGKIIALAAPLGGTMLAEQNDIGADIAYQLSRLHADGSISSEKGPVETAIMFCNEGLRLRESNLKLILQLAKLHLARNDMDLCRQSAQMLLRLDPGNEEATIMLADILFRRNEHETAMYHFQQLLRKKPGHYKALIRLVDLMRRAGKLHEVPRFLRIAQSLTTRSNMSAGLHLAKGMYARFTNNAREALAELNQARNDPEWGDLAIEHMVEVYLTPDRQRLLSTTQQASSLSSSASSASLGGGAASVAADRGEIVRAVESLLKDLRVRNHGRVLPLKRRLLDYYLIMGSGVKADVERALAAFMDVVREDSDSVPGLLGMASAYVMLKQTPKARNQLKRVAKMTYNSLDADEFEQAWLLLANIYIQGGKYDLAQDLLKKVLNVNMSCAQAWEMYGLIMEKEQSYRDAADYYENAWRFSNQSSAPIGFRLSFNYLKAKRYVDAIDVCHQVLRVSPNYPKIKKEILDRARTAVRA